MMQETTPSSDATPPPAGGSGTEASAAESAPAADAPAAAGTQVLIVEDDTFLVRAYEVMLSSQGFNVTVVTDGEEALAKLQGGMRPGVMLLDLMLPKLSGFEVLEQMQTDAGMQEVPVIVLSNLGQPDDVERAKALGAKDYFVKADTPLEKVVSVITQYIKNPSAGSNLEPAASAEAAPPPPVGGAPVAPVTPPVAPPPVAGAPVLPVAPPPVTPVQPSTPGPTSPPPAGPPSNLGSP